MVKRFFPKNIFDANDEEDDYYHRLYAGHLITMREKPIFNTNSPDVSIYRVLYTRSFHIPIMVCVTAKKNENTLKAIVPEEGLTVRSVREKEINKTINENEIQKIEEYIKRIDFWNLHTTVGQRGIVCDGGILLVEAYDKSNKYNIVDRSQGGTLKVINRHFFGLINYLFNLTDSDLPNVGGGRRVRDMAEFFDEKKQ